MNRTWIPIVLIVGLLVAAVLLVNTTQTLSTTQAALTAAYVTATAGAANAAGEATTAAQIAATAQAGAVNAAAHAAATAQADALRDAANEADTAFSATRVAARNAAATAQAEAVADAEDAMATAQANALHEAAEAAATQQANGLTTVRNAQATALVNAIAQAQATAAAEQGLALQAAQETASAVQAELQATIDAQGLLLATAQATTAPASARNSTIPEGWIRIEGYGVALWLPPTWQGGDMRKNADTILDLVEGLDPVFAQSVAVLRQDPEAFRLLAFDTVANNLGAANLNIITQPLPFDISIELLMPTLLNTLPDIYTVVDDDIIQVNGESTGVVVADVKAGPVAVRTIQFFMIRDSVAWVISLTSTVANTEESRAFAEQIIQTIEFFEAE